MTETVIAKGSPRPFKVLGIQQIAIGGPDKTRLQKLWVDMLGLEVTGTFKSERENVDEDICAIPTKKTNRKGWLVREASLLPCLHMRQCPARRFSPAPQSRRQAPAPVRSARPPLQSGIHRCSWGAKT